MRDYNSIPFQSPKQRQQYANAPVSTASTSSTSGPPSAVSKFVPNMDMHYVNNPRQQQQQQSRVSHTTRRFSNGSSSSSNNYNKNNYNNSSTLSMQQLRSKQQPYADVLSKSPPRNKTTSKQPQQELSNSPFSQQSTANTTFTELSVPEVADRTIQRLRNALQEDLSPQNTEDSVEDDEELDRVLEKKKQLQSNSNNNELLAAKSDAVILELRSTVRQLKRQLDKLQDEKTALQKQYKQDFQRDMDNSSLNNNNNDAASAQDARIGEMQVQLDRAHAQILTADMVRKELEDTLEAEQYTWDLRVQDQERMIQQMQEECVALADDLMQCRNQWKEAEREWNMQVDELKGELEHAIQEAEHWKNTMQDGGDSQEVSDLKDHLSELEQERSDLQGCLDEALKELEAVDVELQNDQTLNEFRKENERLRQMMEEGDKKVLESLRHMYRWLLERDGEEEDNVHTSPSDANELIAAIRSHLERHPPSDKDLVETRKQVAKLESQLHVYKGDLKAREESTNELRQSLKEAVALLKPLQDAVTKADEDKLSLQQEVEELRAVKFDDRRDASAQKMRNLKDQLRDKEDECDRLQEEVESLEIQLSRAKVAAAKSLVTPQKSPGFESPTLIRAREELRAKRESESALKQMLADAHDRFNSLQSHNKEVSEMNYELHRRLVDAEDVGQLAQTQSIEFDELKQRQEQAQQEILARDDQIQGLQNELKVLKGDLAVRDAELRQLEKELADAKTVNTRGAASYEHAKIQIHELESKQKALTDDLKAKKESEKKLNKSLKEALSLLKPLQNHLEEAETEKRELWDELVNLRIRTGRRSVSATDSPAQTPELANTQGLEQTITHLERENSQLHDALEEMSQALSQSHMSAMAMTPASKAESKIREELVELKSRCEVTQNRLEDSRVENHSLSEALKKRENEERSMVNEIRLLHEQLAQTQAALESAKFASVDALATTTAEEKKEEVPQNGFNHYENYSQRPRYQGKPKGVQGQSSMYIRRFT